MTANLSAVFRGSVVSTGWPGLGSALRESRAVAAGRCHRNMSPAYNPPHSGSNASVKCDDAMTVRDFGSYLLFTMTIYRLECFDTVGWVSGRASGL